MNNVHEPALPASLGRIFSEPGRAGDALTGGSMHAPAVRNDSIRIFPGREEPPEFPEDGFAGAGFPGGANGLSGIIESLISLVQSLLSALGIGGNGEVPGQQGDRDDRYFERANASSTGDPHLAFDGTAAGGQDVQTRFDSMTPHRDLLESESFEGGYRISTATTSPGVNGITYNQSASVATDFGRTAVTLDANGAATIAENGNSIALADGQSIALQNGESVSRRADGTVVVTDTNRSDGSITTTFSLNGHGVDVNAAASNVALGGDLLRNGGAGAQFGG